MKERFKDILEINDVLGVLFLNLEGKVVFSEFMTQLPTKPDSINWLFFIYSLEKVQEAQLVFENVNLYIRRTVKGYIFVLMGESAIVEMVRIHCDILLPSFEQTEQKPKGLGRFFKR